MDTAIGLVSIALASALLLVGIRKPDISSLVKSILSVLELLMLGLSVVLFGWLGLIVFLAAMAIGFLAWSLHLYIKQESLLTSAAIESGSNKEEMEALLKRVKLNYESLRVLGSIATANLIKFLAQRARSIDEIEQMIDPIAKLHLVFGAELEPLVDRFDRALRLYGHSAGESARLADTLTRGTQLAAATLDEMLDGLIAVALPEPDD